jgi:hypothetical protein
MRLRAARMSGGCRRGSNLHSTDLTMAHSEIHKQISIFLPLPEWRRLREEAAQQKVPITELCRRWMAPHLAALMDRRAN